MIYTRCGNPVTYSRSYPGYGTGPYAPLDTGSRQDPENYQKNLHLNISQK